MEIMIGRTKPVKFKLTLEESMHQEKDAGFTSQTTVVEGDDLSWLLYRIVNAVYLGHDLFIIANLLDNIYRGTDRHPGIEYAGKAIELWLEGACIINSGRENVP